MAPLARELSITYGGYTVGGASANLLDLQIRHDREFARGSTEFEFLVASTSESGFASACAAAEAAFRTPFQDLQVAQGSATLLDARQSANKALDPQPRIVKSQDDANTGRSRLYRVRIEYGLPADVGTPTTGLRDRTVQVAYDSNRRRTVTVRGTFTAVSSNGASAQYDAQKAAMCTAILTALGGIYDLLREETGASINDKTVEFARTFLEIIFPQGQAGSALDDPDVVDQHLELTRRQTGSRSSPHADVPDPSGASTVSTGAGAVLPLAVLEARYLCTIDKERTTDLQGKWTGTLRTAVLRQLETLAGAQYALMEESPSFDMDDNRISCLMVVHAVDRLGGNVVEQTVRVTNRFLPGKVLVPVWTGRPTDRFDFDGPQVRTREVSVRQVRLDVAASLAAGGGAAAALGRGFLFGPDEPLAGDGLWALLDREEPVTPTRWGRDGHEIEAVEIVATWRQEFFTRPLAPSTLGGGGPVTP